MCGCACVKKRRFELGAATCPKLDRVGSTWTRIFDPPATRFKLALFCKCSKYKEETCASCLYRVEQSKLEATARQLSEADRADTLSKADKVKKVELKFLRSLPPMGREAKQHQLVQHRLLVAQHLALSPVLDPSWVAQQLMVGQELAVAYSKTEAALAAFDEAALAAALAAGAALSAGGPATTEAMTNDKL